MKCQVDSIVPDATKSNATVSSHVTSCCFLALRFKCLKRLKVLGQLLTALESGKILNKHVKKSSAEGKNGPSSSNEHHPRMLLHVFTYIYIHKCIHVGNLMSRVRVQFRCGLHNSEPQPMKAMDFSETRDDLITEMLMV